MGKIALLFAGQGAQYPGMGKDFYDNSPLVQDIFAQIERQRPGTKEQCFNGAGGWRSGGCCSGFLSG